MFSKPCRFPRKKLFPQEYYVRKLGKLTKPFGREVLHHKSNNLGNYKPMSIGYLKYLKKILKRRINIWSEGYIAYSYGKNLEKPRIDVKYIENYSKCKNDCFPKIGHFTLKNGKDVLTEKILPNDCLLQVISAQCGIQPDKLRREISRKLRRLKSNCRMKNLIYHTQLPIPITVDAIGGARYSGKSKTHAKRVLDLSQSGESHPNREAGHPRGHASYPKATGVEESVENYSKSGRKTGFLSRSDQDFVAHFVLKTNESQDAMELLNDRGKNGIKEVVKVPAKDLWIDESKLPKVQEWRNGEEFGEPGSINKVVAVMKHHYQKYDDEQADVFVLTLYPTL